MKTEIECMTGKIEIEGDDIVLTAEDKTLAAVLPEGSGITVEIMRGVEPTLIVLERPSAGLTLTLQGRGVVLHNVHDSGAYLEFAAVNMAMTLKVRFYDLFELPVVRSFAVS